MLVLPRSVAVPGHSNVNDSSNTGISTRLSIFKLLSPGTGTLRNRGRLVFGVDKLRTYQSSNNHLNPKTFCLLSGLRFLHQRLSKRFPASGLRLRNEFHDIRVGDDYVRVALQGIEIMMRKTFAAFGWRQQRVRLFDGAIDGCGGQRFL